jgi:hypothetical protein
MENEMKESVFGDVLASAIGEKYVVVSTEASTGRLWLYNARRDLVVVREILKIDGSASYITDYVRLSAEIKPLLDGMTSSKPDFGKPAPPAYVIRGPWKNEPNQYLNIEIFEAVTLDGSLARYAVIQDSTLNVVTQEQAKVLNQSKSSRLVMVGLNPNAGLEGMTVNNVHGHNAISQPEKYKETGEEKAAEPEERADLEAADEPLDKIAEGEDVKPMTVGGFIIRKRDL